MQNQPLHRASIVIVTSMVTVFAGCGSQPSPSPAPVEVQKPMATPSTMPMGAQSAEPMVLKFNENSIKLIQTGSKTATIRKGVRMFGAGSVRAVGTAGSVVMLDSVTTTPKKMSELTEADAKANGSASLDALKAELMKDYPGLTADDVVTVIGFKLGGPSGM